MIASLGAQRKEKPGGPVSARVLFDGTHGLCVNTRTRLRDQERAPIAADLKRSMRGKAKVDELTFALSADVTEAHRQVPIHPDDWPYPWMPSYTWCDVFVNTVRHRIGVLLLVLALLRVYYNISPVIPPLHGICLSPTTTYWNPVGLGIVLDFYSSSYSVLWLAFHFHGTRPAAEILLSGSNLRFF